MNETFEVFLHPEGVRPSVVRVTARDCLDALLRQGNVRQHDDLSLTVVQDLDRDGDSDDVLQLPTPAMTATVDSVAIGRHAHVFCHRCKRVATKVNYQCHTAERAFEPRARVSRVLQWALREFDLSDADAKGLFLRLCGRDSGARPAQHLVEFVDGRDCNVCFDLVPDPKING